MNQKAPINQQNQISKGINQLSINYNQKSALGNLLPNKKLINAGKMILNPYKVSSQQPNLINNNQIASKPTNQQIRPTTTHSQAIKQDNLLPVVLQGKAMSLNSNKLPPREQTYSIHQNKLQTQNQERKSQINNDIIKSKQPQQNIQQQQQPNQINNNTKQMNSQQLMAPENPKQINQQQQIQKIENPVEGLSLEEYFKIPSSQRSKIDEESTCINNYQNEVQKPIENENQLLLKVYSMFSDHFSESERNNHSAGILYNGENDAEFFGFEIEEVDVEKGIQELKSMNLNLSFNLIKCDIDDVRCSQFYEDFIKAMIIYLSNIYSNKFFGQQQVKDHLVKQLQYFVFNGIEDCLFSRDINIELIILLKKDIQNYPQKLVEIFATRIENKFFMVEDNEKMDECFKLLMKFLQINNYLNQVVLNSILKFIKSKRLRDILCEIFNQQQITDLINNESSLVLVLTLKSYNCLPFELPAFSTEQFENNKILTKLYKKLYQTNKKE
ncbi:hypothetical protein ABPG72_006751 [Tetrahymena utriculariae]